LNLLTSNISVARRSRAGFTLVELIVAAVIGVLIAGAVATSISQLFRARGSSAAHQQAFARADGAAARIALDMSNALRRNDPLQEKIAVINGGAPGQERDEVLMLARSMRPVRGDPSNPEGDEYEVQYRVMPAGDGASALWRRSDMAHDEYVDAGGIASPITGGMVALSVQANDGSDQWFEEWDSDSDGLPHAVRISVTAQSDDAKASATAVRIVAIDRVPIPPPSEDPSSSGSNSTNSASGRSGSNSSNTSNATGYTTSRPSTTPPPSSGGKSGGSGGGGTRGGGSTRGGS
jgi:type II secretion system protein J